MSGFLKFLNEFELEGEPINNVNELALNWVKEKIQKNSPYGITIGSYDYIRDNEPYVSFTPEDLSNSSTESILIDFMNKRTIGNYINEPKFELVFTSKQDKDDFINKVFNIMVDSLTMNYEKEATEKCRRIFLKVGN